jgi:uncharacterized protein (DUF305 family)
MKPARLSLLRSTLLCASLLVAGGAHAQDSQPLVDAMMQGMRGMRDMKPTGDIDKDFALLMKLHHEQALLMARAELKYGKSPRLKEMAEEIIDTQKEQIEMFENWLQRER